VETKNSFQNAGEAELLSVCLFATGLKKTKTEGKQCHDKTMKSKRSW
jgi:hypothetical protein